MDANWRPTQGSDPAAAVGDWRAQLQPEARSRVVNQILDALKKNLPVSVPDGLDQLKKIAEGFEDKFYTEATNQSDYLRKISLKMVSMETNGQQTPGNAQVIPNQNNSAPALPPQGRNQAQTSTAATVGRQQQQAHPSIQQPSLQRQQPNIPLQQHLSGHQPNLQQNQLICQQNGAVEMQEQPRLPVQSNNLLYVQQTQQIWNRMHMPMRGLQDVSSSTSAESSAQTGDAGADYWQEEIYQMVKMLKDQYFAELSELFNKLCVKLQHVESITPLPIPSERYDRMKSFKMMLERILQMLQITKSSIQPDMRYRVPEIEKQIIVILNATTSRKIFSAEPPAGQVPNSSISH